MSFGIWKVFLETQQVVRRYIEEAAQRSDIFQTGFITIPFNIGNLSLRHAHFGTQFCLIQFSFFPEQSDFLSKGQFHIHHRVKFIIDSNFLFTFR